MKFTAADIAEILDTTGQDIQVLSGGIATGQTIRGKFRKDFESVSPFEAGVGQLNPSFMCATAGMAGITGSNTFIVDGIEYRLHGKPQELPSGFTRVTLAKK